MSTTPFLFFLLVPLTSVSGTNTLYEFGLMENEILLVKLLREEIDMLSALRQSGERRILDYFREYFDLLDEKNLPAERVVTNPVDAYNLVKAGHKMSLLMARLESGKSAGRRALFRRYNGTEVLRTVDKEDMEGAAKAITVLVYFYEIDPGKLRNGAGHFSVL